MEALVLEKKDELSLRDISVEEEPGPRDVRIKIHTVGICGSDVHYYVHGGIGPYVVDQPMILGHEGSGTIVEIGSEVESLKVGDRVCMEPGVPDTHSSAYKLGIYNLDPGVRFWATPPIHGIMRPYVVHPESFTFKLPDNISYAEGAMVEPLAVGMHAATKARVKPGDVAVVMGAGTIGMVTMLSALAAGCSKIIATDVSQPKLDLAASLGPIVSVNVAETDLASVVAKHTNGWGADLVFEASGNESAIESMFSVLAPGGRVVVIGLPLDPTPVDFVQAITREATISTIFRYAHVFPRALSLMSDKALGKTWA